ncbi:hypothetical protein BZA05DRAFT_422706 [Tricharina praecox]|uniref:uncharacterized protein n=1 Tax=Tricharina praecox TaxID=43433 RepID=UPI00221E4F13|nr:uncharacterized protein BZA05DRAFT_422706 [Tricharina praecox]KAI5842014.1 hypothetical protein BZA05DRAFT_422706 [Tricharina praecox]
MTIRCYYALIGAAHTATIEKIKAAIRLAIKEVRRGAIRYHDLSAAENVLTSQRCREEYDRRHARGCQVCIRQPAGLEAESPLARIGSHPSRSKQPVDVTRRVGVYKTCPLRSLLAKRQRKAGTFSRPLWEAADTKRCAAAKERLVLVAEGGATVDTICGRMGWTVGAKSRDE